MKKHKLPYWFSFIPAYAVGLILAFLLMGLGTLNGAAFSVSWGTPEWAGTSIDSIVIYDDAETGLVSFIPSETNKEVALNSIIDRIWINCTIPESLSSQVYLTFPFTQFSDWTMLHLNITDPLGTVTVWPQSSYYGFVDNGDDTYTVIYLYDNLNYELTQLGAYGLSINWAFGFNEA